MYCIYSLHGNLPKDPNNFLSSLAYTPSPHVDEMMLGSMNPFERRSLALNLMTRDFIR
jgi:hypothetical protein